MHTKTEQQLVDIAFELVLTMHANRKSFKNKSREEVAEWVAKQLANCGFKTEPCGSSWGVLK